MKRIENVGALLLLNAAFIFSGAALSDAEPLTGAAVSRSIRVESGMDRIVRAIDMSTAARLKGDVDWLIANGKCSSGVNAHLEFTGSYIQKKNNLVGYVRGTLFLKDGILSGEGKQYFNDRTWEKSSSQSTSSDGGAVFNIPQHNPFNPDSTERLGLDVDPATGKAKIILLSYGGEASEMQLEHKNGVFYGFPSSGGMHAFVLKRVEKACVR